MKQNFQPGNWKRFTCLRSVFKEWDKQLHLQPPFKKFTPLTYFLFTFCCHNIFILTTFRIGIGDFWPSSSSVSHYQRAVVNSRWVTFSCRGMRVIPYQSHLKRGTSLYYKRHPTCSQQPVFYKYSNSVRPSKKLPTPSILLLLQHNHMIG